MTAAPVGDLRVLHADALCLVVDKPAGLLAVPGRGPDKQDALSARLQALYPDALIVHRLDQATSGLMVFARGLAAQRRLSRDFMERRIGKRYEAVAAGRLSPGTGCIALPVAADWPNRPLQRVDAEHGRPALTHWRVLEAHADHTRVELIPVTGRTHQLRVHLQALGHPLLGDTLYAPPAVQALSSRLLLHASLLSFSHPHGGETLHFESPAPF